MTRPTVLPPAPPVEIPDDIEPEALMRIALDKLRMQAAAAGRLPRDRQRALAITALEEAVLWLNAEPLLP